MRNELETVGLYLMEDRDKEKCGTEIGPFLFKKQMRLHQIINWWFPPSSGGRGGSSGAARREVWRTERLSCPA